MPAPAIAICPASGIFYRSGCVGVVKSAGRVGLVSLKLRIVAVQRRAVRADLFGLVAHVEEDVRVVEGRVSPNAHELLHPNRDRGMTCVVLEMRYRVASHEMLPDSYADCACESVCRINVVFAS